MEKRQIYLFYGFTVLGAIYIVYSIILQTTLTDRPFIKSIRKKSPKPLTILLDPATLVIWRDARRILDPDDPEGRVRSIDPRSQEVKCVFTDDLKRWDDADAILFYIRADNVTYPRRFHSNWSKVNPSRKRLTRPQITIFFEGDSPLDNFRFPSKRFLENSYNWTFTYRRDSTVPGPYGSFHLYPGVVPPTHVEIEAMHRHKMAVPSERLDFFKKTYLGSKGTLSSKITNITSKTLVAWMSSHCQTESGREDLVEKLKTFVPLDVYGRCGRFWCEGRSWLCFKYFSQHYKFYLSFENALCLDYVTEKLYYALKYGIVPVVYGIADYAQVAPPGSYINALDFPDVESLANYLKFLDEHPEEYLKYFLWKEKYWVKITFPWWDICDKLYEISEVNENNERVIRKNYSRSNDDITSWWFSGPKNRSSSGPICRPPHIFPLRRESLNKNETQF